MELLSFTQFDFQHWLELSVSFRPR